MFRFRAFRAIDDPNACKKYVEGHANVLKEYGVTKVTSSNNEWMYNPFVYVVTVTDDNSDDIVSGVRIHIAHEDYPLPMEKAIFQVDKSIFDLVKSYSKDGTGEVSGLWNSKSISGYGIGALFLSRTAIAIASQLKLGSLFALCAEYTLKPTLQKGFVMEESVGNKGTFFYPKLDLIATCTVLKDVDSLSLALPEEREYIHNLRKNFHSVQFEDSPKGRIQITYELLIKNPDWRLDLCL